MSSSTAVRRILVLGDDERSCLATIRSLGRKGVEVHLAGAEDGCPALQSRYVTKAYSLPPFIPGESAWCAAVAAILDGCRFDLVVPCSDPFILALREHASVLSPRARLYLLPDAVFRVVQDKWETALIASSLGIPVASGTVVTESRQAAELMERHGFPMILKPVVSCDAAQPMRIRHVQTAYSEGDLHRLLGDMLADGTVIAQSFCAGRGVGVEFLAKEGRILYAFQHERVHEPLRGGGSSYRRSVPLDPVHYGQTEQLIAALGYTGVGMAEFRVDDATKRGILLEINGRMWGSLPLAVAAGADFPWFLVQMLLDGRTDFAPGYRKGLYARNWPRDLVWMVRNGLADRQDPVLCTRPLATVLRECLNPLFLRETSDTLVLDDPAPAWAEWRALALRATWRTGMRLLDVAWNVQPVRHWMVRRACEALGRARTILFICKGNICRSPFAKEYADRVFAGTGRVFLSAGYYPQSGRGAPAVALEAAAAAGIDLSAHRSVLLTDELLRKADMVIVMDAENRMELSRRSAAAGKVYFLGALAALGTLFIADPYGKDRNCFDRQYARIAQTLEAAAASFSRA